MPATATEDSPTAMMTARIERAVESGEGSVELLEQWLQGFDLPPLGVDEEPYVWILRGHAEAVERVQAEKALAAWLAELFEKKPDVEPLGEFPDRLLFNAFLLAAGLASPDELWEPLLAIYERRELGGDYLGLDHRSSLRSALSQNQLDARLEPVWRAMATGKETDFLPGNAYNGFEALAMMPDPEQGRGHPALGALGEALTHVVTELDEQPRLRIRRLERLLNRLLSLYPGTEKSIVSRLSAMAARTEWPYWASGVFQKHIERRERLPGQRGGVRHPRDLGYRRQLREKRKVKRIYGVLGEHFRNYFKEADRKKGITGENLLIELERRLDNVVYSLGFAASRAQARQLVRHGHVRVDGHKVSIPSFQVRAGQKVTIKETSRKNESIRVSVETARGLGVPEWLELDADNFSGTVLRLPTREDIGSTQQTPEDFIEEA